MLDHDPIKQTPEDTTQSSASSTDTKDKVQAFAKPLGKHCGHGDEQSSVACQNRSLLAFHACYCRERIHT